ncbi:MAG: ABC transporter permease [Clostridiales bacterium]|nr:ABC transporter permease [Clostridiales bacterium]
MRSSKIYIALCFVLLYAPIVILIFFSFNSLESTGVFGGFSLKWYEALLQNELAKEALINSIIIAVSSCIVATVIGTFAALGISKIKSKFFKSSVMTVTNIPMVNPEIVTAVSMAFLFMGTLASLGFIKNDDTVDMISLLIAHTTFGLPYVILSVLPKIRQMDKSQTEAALDLGCKPIQAFFKVELPQLMPGILTGLIMAFTMSFDDFVISYFVRPKSTVMTLPLLIYSMTGKGTVTPDMYALSTFMIVAIFTLLILANIAGSRQEIQASRQARKLRKQQEAKK